MSYGPWGHKPSDMTELLTLPQVLVLQVGWSEVCSTLSPKKFPMGEAPVTMGLITHLQLVLWDQFSNKLSKLAPES